MNYTVIVPVFNGEDTIEECIRSLLNQKNVTYNEDYTIIVVDDGSTDNTSQLLSKFPVRVIRLPQNEGRIVARLTGAKNATTDRILFVDSRIALADDTICKLGDFSDHSAVIGETNLEGWKYESFLNTVLYLVRRKYYGKENFPTPINDLLITAENFKRAPKGTAALFIDKDLFIKLTPERTGKEVNDDTLLFHNLIFKQRLNLLRSKKLFFKYSPRTDFKQFSHWLFQRGVRFSDFYLRPGGYFFIPFLLVSVILLAALIGTALSLMLCPRRIYYFISFVCAINALLSLYLSENRQDILRAFLGLPLVVTIFGSGIARFWFTALSATIKTAYNRSV
jgi:glycosyltransferase involved in cell wall biosynthesis